LNAVEIEEAISQLADQPFDPRTFPYSFLEAFGNKETTIKRLRTGASNKSDLGGVLQANNIHFVTSDTGQVTETLAALKASPATVKAKAKFILATDGVDFEAENLASGETIACAYKNFPDHFGFFLPLAGITTVRQISENAFDIRATSRLNRLYVELLKDNPEWGTSERRHDMNHFMARLIFCFFAEDTDIFKGTRLFTDTIAQMSAKDSSNTHDVVGELFRAMNTKNEDRESARIPRWADTFPFVNGGLFSGNMDVPHFSRIARSYLLHIGNLDWTKINPDIFGSMIQAVADDEERGALGLHYTSVPNILKVLNPLLLDDVRAKLEDAGDNPRKLLNLRDLTNFRGIELRDFPAEVARLALIIAEFQCDVLYRGQKEALAEFLPLDAQNWITCGNALLMDWLSICPATGTNVKLRAEDLFSTPLDQAQIDFENEGGETYICGNPPYKGSQTQTKEQKSDLAQVFDSYGISSKQIDYVGGWFMKAAEYAQHTVAESAFVSTNSICQGRIVPILWPKILETGSIIRFAHTSFKWANLASYNAGVTVAIVSLSRSKTKKRYLFDLSRDGDTTAREAGSITPYLTIGENVVVTSKRESIAGLHDMSFGNMPVDGGNLLLSAGEVAELRLAATEKDIFIRRIYGSAEFIRGLVRYCLWIADDQLEAALAIAPVRSRIDEARAGRLASKDAGTREMATRAHQFREMNEAKTDTLILPGVSSENREYLQVGLLDNRSTVSNLAFALYDAPLWNAALIASRLHLVWIATVCGKLETRYRYSNTLGWNTFPVPTLTEKNRFDLTRCAEDILLARERYFPATIADLYDPDNMPHDLRAAHERNDEVLERIYVGRRFKNDTERLEKLFELYTKMTASPGSVRKRRAGRVNDV
jgi:hypothetical protein